MAGDTGRGRMIRRAFSLSGETGPIAYALIAPLLIGVQHLVMFVAYRRANLTWSSDLESALTPIGILADLPAFDSITSNVGFATCLLVAIALSILSFRRANWAGGGHWLALLTMVPTIQMFAALALAILPRVDGRMYPATPQEVAKRRQVLIGLFAGMSIIVLAVVVSALSFGAYGWGLFVMTPLLVGVTTGYAVNHGEPRSVASTINLVTFAGLLGSLALLMLALEGLMCIMLIAPMAMALAMAGGMVGRAAAIRIHHPAQPMMALAFLPLLFVLDSAMPPEMPIAAQHSIVIAAPASDVWRAMTDNRPVAADGGLVGFAGLAYPIESHLVGTGTDRRRIGRFSTGIANEQVTAWQPGHLLAFRVIDQPPAMEEMSPYRQVHAPHVSGYFDTVDTRFELTPMADGRTRLTAQSTHVLRIDPVIYWEPIARWAIGQNVGRVLRDIRDKAEDGSTPRRGGGTVAA